MERLFAAGDMNWGGKKIEANPSTGAPFQPKTPGKARACLTLPLICQVSCAFFRDG